MFFRWFFFSFSTYFFIFPRPLTHFIFTLSLYPPRKSNSLPAFSSFYLDFFPPNNSLLLTPSLLSPQTLPYLNLNNSLLHSHSLSAFSYFFSYFPCFSSFHTPSLLLPPSPFSLPPLLYLTRSQLLPHSLCSFICNNSPIAPSFLSSRKFYV